MPAYRNLPVIGGMAGQGRTLNPEVLLQVKPDLLLFWSWRDDATNRKFLDSMASNPFPVVALRMDTITDYPAALAFAGELLGRKERAETLRSYAQQAIDEARNISATITEADNNEFGWRPLTMEEDDLTEIVIPDRPETAGETE